VQMNDGKKRIICIRCGRVFSAPLTSKRKYCPLCVAEMAHEWGKLGPEVRKMKQREKLTNEAQTS